MAKRNKVDLKLVVATNIWINTGNEDMPLWKVVGGKEYIVEYFTQEPTIEEIGKVVADKIHFIQGGDSSSREILAGWQLYLKDAMTHSEFFQLNLNGNVDFPPTDITVIPDE